MKIAFLSFYSGTVARGVETFVHELANRLSDKDFDVTVYQYGPRLPETRYKVVSVQVPVNWNRAKNAFIPATLYFGWKVKKFTGKVLSIIDKDTDVIFPTNGQWQGVMCSVWAKFHHKKIVVSGQSGPGIDERINLWGFPDIFVALTEYQKKWAKRVNPRVRVEKIPNGVDFKKFGKVALPYDFNLPRPVILCVAALDFWKRQDLAIKAVSKLPEGSLVLVGKGPQEKKLEELGKKLLPGRFEILNFAHEDMPPVYAGADLFTFPTVPFESFGIVLLEAMASGLAVVATKDLKRREIIGDAGVLVDPTDIGQFAEVLKMALKEKWADKPVRQAKKFDWDIIAGQYEKLFESLKKQE